MSIAAGAGIVAGGAIGGSLISSLFASASGKKRRRREDTFVRRRVADAKAAGIHPLYSLGISPQAGVPYRIGGDRLGKGLSEASQHIGRTIARQETTLQKATTEAELGLIAAQTRNIEARTRELGNPGVSVPGSFREGKGRVGATLQGAFQQSGQAAPEATQGFFNVSPAETTSAKTGMPGFESGKSPYYEEYQIGPGFYMMLPKSDEGPEETIEAMGIAAFNGLILQNAKVYGKEYYWDAMGWRYGGIKPKGTYRPAKKSQRQWQRPTRGRPWYEFWK